MVSPCKKTKQKYDFEELQFSAAKVQNDKNKVILHR
jgi:hypothetical protein